jgi:plastocyanin
MKKAIIWIALIFILIIGLFFIFRNDNSSNIENEKKIQIPDSINPVEEDKNIEAPDTENEVAEETILEGEPQTHTIQIKPSAFWFSPRTLTIRAGDTVRFINQGTENHWPASNQHPTHKIYPGSDIKKCGSPEENRIFDACGPLGPGESYSFTFTQRGNWHYHDHLRASLGGTIVVE